MASTPVQESDWPNQKKVVSGVVPMNKVPQDPDLYVLEESDEEVLREMGE